MNDEIRYVSRDDNEERQAIRREADIYYECRKFAELLWQSLISKGLLDPIKEPPTVTEALVSVIHSNVLWHCSKAWHVHTEQPSKEISWWEAIKAFFK